jgi:hypothetical protein
VIALLVDQNFNEHIIDGMTRRNSGLDVIHVRDLDLAAAPDAQLLERAAAEGRVLLTHDRQTIPRHAYDRAAAGQRMPGIFLVSNDMPIGQAVEELLIAIQCLAPEECEAVVVYFPL